MQGDEGSLKGVARDRWSLFWDAYIQPSSPVATASLLPGFKQVCGGAGGVPAHGAKVDTGGWAPCFIWNKAHITSPWQVVGSPSAAGLPETG